VIHCEIVRQAAQVVAMDRERLRSGDRACVRFRFLQRPEYLTPGTRFVFRCVRCVRCVWFVCVVLYVLLAVCCVARSVAELATCPFLLL
jgi:GTPase